MWQEELVRQHRTELERQAAEGLLARDVRRQRGRQVWLRGFIAAALHRAGDWVERGSLSVRHREPC